MRTPPTELNTFKSIKLQVLPRLLTVHYTSSHKRVYWKTASFFFPLLRDERSFWNNPWRDHRPCHEINYVLWDVHDVDFCRLWAGSRLIASADYFGNNRRWCALHAHHFRRHEYSSRGAEVLAGIIRDTQRTNQHITRVFLMLDMVVWQVDFSEIKGTGSRALPHALDGDICKMLCLFLDELSLSSLSCSFCAAQTLTPHFFRTTLCHELLEVGARTFVYFCFEILRTGWRFFVFLHNVQKARQRGERASQFPAHSWSRAWLTGGEKNKSQTPLLAMS